MITWPASSIPVCIRQPNPRCAAAGASKVTCGNKCWSDRATALQLVHCLVDLPGTVHFRLSGWKKPGNRIQEEHFLDSLQVGDQHFSRRLCRWIDLSTAGCLVYVSHFTSEWSGKTSQALSHKQLHAGSSLCMSLSFYALTRLSLSYSEVGVST